MSPIKSCALPVEALLNRYLVGGSYADCYVAEIEGRVAHAAFVEAFYTTTVFRVERLILKLLCARPSTDLQAKQLAHGQRDSFAAWRVEGRTSNQLLLADFTGRTKSWLMVAVADSHGVATTRLYFGSAVVPIASAKTGQATLGLVFRSLLGFHKIYSRVLLLAARSKLTR